jgi:hypothetical protein
MRRFSALLIASVITLFMPTPSAAITCYAGDISDGWCCETYPNTRIANFEGFGDVCAYYGQGCTECFDTREGDSCVTTSTYCSVRRPLHPR